MMNTTKDKSMTHSPPREVIVDILQRLPVRSLLRFKCVCKSWKYLISNNRQFAESNSDITQHRFLLVPSTYNGSYITCLDVEASPSVDSALIHLPVPTPPLPLPDSIRFMGSCRGFILCRYPEFTECFIWNPLTGFSRKIPGDSLTICESCACGFGFDTFAHDYILVVFRSGQRINEVRFFSFGKRSWKKIELGRDDGDYSVCDDSKQGILVNGALHWLVTRVSDNKQFPVIMAFDLTKRRAFEIRLPSHLVEDPECEFLCLRELAEYLTVCCSRVSVVRSGRYQTRRRRVETCEIWAMREYKVDSSWTKTFVLPDFNSEASFFPFCITKDSAVLGLNVKLGRVEKRSENGELLDHVARLSFPTKSLDPCRHDPECALVGGTLLSFPGPSIAMKYCDAPRLS